MSYRKGKFEIDTVQGPYDGYTDGDAWNGWAVPYFEFDAAKEIIGDAVRTNNKLGGEWAGAHGGYDEENDVFTFYDPINDDEAEFSSFEIEVDGKPVKVYAIGSGEWTWEEVEGDEE